MKNALDYSNEMLLYVYIDKYKLTDNGNGIMPFGRILGSYEQ